MNISQVMSDGITDAMREASREAIIDYEIRRLKALIGQMQSTVEYIEFEWEEYKKEKS